MSTRHLKFNVAPDQVWATARVELVITRDGDGSLVTIVETAGDLLSRRAINPLTYKLMDRRNDETLRRLRRITKTGIAKS